MDRLNMDLELKVNKVPEVFPTTAVSLWLFKYKIVKILNIQMEVAFYLEVERTVRLVAIKTMGCMLRQGHLRRSSRTQTLQA